MVGCVQKQQCTVSCECVVYLWCAITAHQDEYKTLLMLLLLWYNQTISVNADTPAPQLDTHKGFFKHVFAVVLRLLSSRPRYILLGQLKYQPPLQVTSLMLPHRAARFFTQQRWYRCSLLLDLIVNRRWGRDELLQQPYGESA